MLRSNIKKMEEVIEAIEHFKIFKLVQEWFLVICYRLLNLKKIKKKVFYLYLEQLVLIKLSEVVSPNMTVVLQILIQ